MREQLLKALQRNQLVTIIYMSKKGVLTKRQIHITKLNENSFQAYCFLKGAKRTFIINNVLALIPVIYREREAILC